ncbi:hypothetical protein NPIL_338781 [Nephila pilipes]|uniref:Uncharacterized protein n=1 Tax=Nephila pilipes TaxID=299642 RepID=A0A8X6T5H5_NEPPI|nr:hypothetical protein NPIL_338781 [Nephila pilipes]
MTCGNNTPKKGSLLKTSCTTIHKTCTHGSQVGKTVPVGDLVGDFIPVRFLQLHQKGIGEDLFPGHRDPDGHPTDHCNDPKPL